MITDPLSGTHINRKLIRKGSDSCLDILKGVLGVPSGDSTCCTKPLIQVCLFLLTISLIHGINVSAKYLQIRFTKRNKRDINIFKILLKLRALVSKNKQKRIRNEQANNKMCFQFLCLAMIVSRIHKELLQQSF